MDWFEIVVGVILGGLGLGGAVAGAFSYRRGAEVKLKDTIIRDSEKRIEQLEEENSRLEAERDEWKQRVTQLEAERQLPLTQLTELIVKNHTEQAKQTKTITNSLRSAVSLMNKAVKTLTDGGNK